jgi:hypothetical protein
MAHLQTRRLLFGAAIGWALFALAEHSAYDLSQRSVTVVVISALLASMSSGALAIRPSSTVAYSLGGLAVVFALSSRIVAFWVADIPPGSVALVYRLPGIVISVMFLGLHGHWWLTEVSNCHSIGAISEDDGR